MNIIKSFLTKCPCYTTNRNVSIGKTKSSRYESFQKTGPKGLMLHSVGCAQPSAKAFVDSWNTISHDQSCVHAFIDADTGDIYQTLPWHYRAWHCGSGPKGSGNDTHVGVEMCESKYIKYTGSSSFKILNRASARADATRAYISAVQLFAELCETYKLDPTKDGVIISHREGCLRGIASNHGDPEHYWKNLSLSYTMDTFRKDVKDYMTDKKAVPVAEKADSQISTDAALTTAATPTPAKMYRVQCGAFAEKKYAQTRMDKLKAKGFDAIIKTAPDGFYKVQAGACSTKSAASEIVSKIKKAGFEAIINYE